jgi:hypothetical protein
MQSLPIFSQRTIANARCWASRYFFLSASRISFLRLSIWPSGQSRSRRQSTSSASNLAASDARSASRLRSFASDWALGADAEHRIPFAKRPYLVG